MASRPLRFLRPAAALLAVLAASLAVLPAHAQWKWRDAKGQTHVSDLPPPRDVPDKDVLQRPATLAPRAAPAASAASAAEAAKPAVDPELEERKRRAEQEQAQRQKADDRKVAEARKENCRRAQEQLALMDSGVRVVRMKPNGEQEFLDDEQRAREAQRARQAIAEDCR
jgi:hypothetical protein